MSEIAARRHRSRVRYLLAVTGVLVILGALAGVKFTQVSSLIAVGKAAARSGPPPEAVGTAVAAEQRWEGTLAAVGTVTAAKGVTVSNEAAGVVSAIRFDSGAAVTRGQILVALDAAVERAQLASVRARRELAETNAVRSRALIKSGVIAGAQLDSDEAALKSGRAEEAALRAQIERKLVRAPFAGRLGIRLINVGQFLNPGTPIVELQAVDALYVDFTLPQQRAAALAVGLPVRVTVGGQAAALAGAIAVIDPALDAATRALRLRAAVANPGRLLRPGMFANVEVVLPARGPRVTVPATAIVRAPYGDSLYVVEPPPAGAPAATGAGPTRLARQQFVRTGAARGDFVVVEEGVRAGQEVVVAGAFKLRNGARVVVHNEVQPAAQLAPRPANR